MQRSTSTGSTSAVSVTVNNAPAAVQLKRSLSVRGRGAAAANSRRHTTLASLLAAGLTAFLLLTPRATLRMLVQAPASHCVIIDAGSSGTRAHVFRYLPRPGRSPRLPAPPAVLKLTPGLSAFAGDGAADEAGLAAQLGSLLAFAARHVPAGERADTPVVLLATAGLRLLAPEAAEGVLRACRPLLAAGPFRFRDDWAHVLTGSDEGAFAWVAANYAYGLLDAAQPLKTVGVMELGGASAQLTFVPSETPPRRYRKDVRVPGAAPHNLVRYTLHTHSFLGLGLDAAREAAHVRPAAGADAPPGDRCATWVTCVAEARAALGLAAPCAYQRCLGGGELAPPLRGAFVALENFWHTKEALQLGDDASLTQLRAAAVARACAGEPGAAGAEAEAEAADGSEGGGGAAALCFNAAYVHSFLSDGLGVGQGEGERPELRFVREAGGLQMDWPLGALVAQYAALAPAPAWLSGGRLRGLALLVACLAPAGAWAARAWGPGEEGQRSPSAAVLRAL